jgi:hypothetical protein
MLTSRPNRLHVSLSDKELSLVKAMADERGWSLARTVREALRLARAKAREDKGIVVDTRRA